MIRRGEAMTWRIASMKRTPNGVFVELEAVDGDGWLKMYVKPEAVDAYRFDQTYQLTIEEV